MIYLGTSFCHQLFHSIISNTTEYFVVIGIVNLLLIIISNSIFLQLSYKTEVVLGIMIFVISPLYRYLNLKRRAVGLL